MLPVEGRNPAFPTSGLPEQEKAHILLGPPSLAGERHQSASGVRCNALSVNELINHYASESMRYVFCSHSVSITSSSQAKGRHGVGFLIMVFGVIVCHWFFTSRSVSCNMLFANELSNYYSAVMVHIVFCSHSVSSRFSSQRLCCHKALRDMCITMRQWGREPPRA